MADVQSEIARYVEAAIRYTQAKDTVDLYGASRAEDEVIDALLRIRSISDGSLQPLGALLSHQNSGVRCWAATHLLWEYPERAANVLKSLPEGSGFIGFDPQMVIEEWEKGRLRPPWEMKRKESDRVWNRAALRGNSETWLKGDRALAALLLAHGLVMNGGVFHAVEVLSDGEFDEAIAGYQFFGLGSVQKVLVHARELARKGAEIGPYEAVFDSDYQKLIPSDAALGSAFERHYNSNPQDYAPMN